MSQYPHPVLIAGQWQQANSTDSFQAKNPATGETLPDVYPVSDWKDLDLALAAAHEAAVDMRYLEPAKLAAFLRSYADKIEANKEAICEAANKETALPKSPRLMDVELPRTTNQLRLAAQAVEERSWRAATIDTKANIRSFLAPVGPVAVFGPNNFPLAFNGISGGDFAAAIAAGNPVIAKGHPLHPTTTRLLAEAAHAAVQEAGLPAAAVQLVYHIGREDGLRLVSHRRIAASAFTGSRKGGLALKEAADTAGKLIYLEMSSINPVIMLPGAINERSDALADEYVGSVLMGAGQFCTNPGVLMLMAGIATERFVEGLVERVNKANAGVLFSSDGQAGLQRSVETLEAAGAELLTGGDAIPGDACRFANTLLKISGAEFLAQPEKFQTEAFGNAGLIVVAETTSELASVLDTLEGNLTGCFYTHTSGEDDRLYDQLERHLRYKVGRLLNDKMPTGVAVSPAMQHGGPYPSTGHPGFTAVGIPTSLRRFAQLQAYDAVRQHRLPAELQDKNPTGSMWRLVDGAWTQGDVNG
jgi:NADP-dependent aldehyde dehydrogenase